MSLVSVINKVNNLSRNIYMANDRLLHSDPVNSATVYNYPDNLGEIEQPHSIYFFINSRTTTTVGQSKGPNGQRLTSGQFVNEDYTNTGRLAAENNHDLIAPVKTLGKALTVGATAKAAKTVSNFVSGGGNSGLVGNALGLLGGISGYLAADNLLGKTMEGFERVRLLSAIRLHVPNSPGVGYGARWENKEMGTLGGTMAEFGADGIGEALKTAGPAAARQMIQAAASVTNQLGLTGDLGAAFDVAAGNTANPFKEQLFKSMDFRKFSFTYRFVPKNETEFKEVMSIIQLFRYHMHPEKSTAGFFLEYPSEFVIEYHYKDAENPYINKIAPCALSGLQVTYGGADSFTTFKGTNGAPAEINMKLQFEELEMLTSGSDGRVKLEFDETLGAGF